LGNHFLILGNYFETFATRANLEKSSPNIEKESDDFEKTFLKAIKLLRNAGKRFLNLENGVFANIQKWSPSWDVECQNQTCPTNRNGV